MPKARRGNLWHPRPTRSPCLCEEPTSPCHCAESTFSIRHCEERSDEAISGTQRPYKRECGTPKERLPRGYKTAPRNDNTGEHENWLSEIASHHFVVLAMTKSVGNTKARLLRPLAGPRNDKIGKVLAITKKK